MSKFDKDLGLFSPFYYRYVDDILRTMLKGGEEYLLNFVNTMHPNLKFTLESEDNEGGLSFLDMRVEHVGNKIEASWYTKKTDTGVVLNYNSEAPNIFKSGIVSGFVHRIFNTCSSWSRFHDGLMKAQKILRDNQYPTGFIEKITSHTLDNILAPVKSGLPVKPNRPKADLNIGLKLMYNGPSSITFAKNLKKTLEPLASLNVYFTTTKLMSNLPSLKAIVPKPIRSHLVYEISCSACCGTYVGQTIRHLDVRIREHKNKSTPVGQHFSNCGLNLSLEDVRILATEQHPKTLLALEAVLIRRKKPNLNTRDEFRSHTLNYVF